MPEASADEQYAREAARQKAWEGLDVAVKELLAQERMDRVKIDYSRYPLEMKDGAVVDYTVDGTVELVRVAKRRPKNG